MIRGWNISLELVLLGSYSLSRSENKSRKTKLKKNVKERRRKKRSKIGLNSHWWIPWTGLMLPITVVAPRKREVSDSSIRAWLLVQLNLARLTKKHRQLETLRVTILRRLCLVPQEEFHQSKDPYFKWWEVVSKTSSSKLVQLWRVVWQWEIKISRSFREESQLHLKLVREVLRPEVWFLEAQELREELDRRSLKV